MRTEVEMGRASEEGGRAQQEPRAAVRRGTGRGVGAGTAGAWPLGRPPGGVETHPLTFTLAAVLAVAGDTLPTLGGALPRAAHAGGVTFCNEGPGVAT